MKKWVVEDWGFELTAIEGKASHCRLGLEKGDKFTFSYECPEGMCPRVMAHVYTWCEVIRCGGNFTYRGSKEKYEMDLVCPCDCIHFHLKAIPINRDENGNFFIQAAGLAYHRRTTCGAYHQGRASRPCISSRASVYLPAA